MNKFTFRQVILLLAFVLVLPSYSQDKKHYVSLNQNETEWTITHGDDVLFHGTGHVDFNNMPPFIKYVVDSLDAVKPVNRVKKNAGMNHAPATIIVEPLITTSWDQGAPYNDLMPTIDGVHVLAGCGTISTAQIINYYRYMLPWSIAYDQIYFGSERLESDYITWYDPSEVLCPEPVYNVKYSFPGWSDDITPAKLCEAVAFGQAADFYPNETTTYSDAQFKAILKRFGYLTEYIETSYESVSDILKEQLDTQRPVIINASDIQAIGHSFIADGYNSAGEFHLNLGWGDSWNCWSTPEYWEFNRWMNIITMYPDYNDESLFIKEDDPGTLIFHNLTTGEVFEKELEVGLVTYDYTGLLIPGIISPESSFDITAGEYEFCIEYKSGKQISVSLPDPEPYELYSRYCHTSSDYIRGTSRLNVPTDCCVTFYAHTILNYGLEVGLSDFQLDSYSVGDVDFYLTNEQSTLNLSVTSDPSESCLYYTAIVENIPAGNYQITANVHGEIVGDYVIGIPTYNPHEYEEVINNNYEGSNGWDYWYGCMSAWYDTSASYINPLMIKLPRHNTKGSYTLSLYMDAISIGLYANWIDELDENGNVIYVPLESTITYTVDGQVYKTDNVEIDSEIELPDAPEKDGYTFYRWEGLPEDMIMPDHDITVTAVYALRGDVNLDEKVNITDAVDIVNYCLGYGSINFEAVLSDVNRDEMYTITDAISVLNIIYGEPVSYAPRRVNASCESLDLSQMNNNTIALCMNSANGYSAFQFDVELPEGVELDAIALNNDRCKDFAVRFNKVEDNIYKVVAYNLANEPLANGSDNLLTLNLSGANESDEVRVTNIHFSTQKAVDVMFEDMALSMTTGIQSHTVATDDVEYNVAGLRVNKDYRGIVIVNGKKVIRK